MADSIVIDTGPILALVRAEGLQIVRLLPIEFVCPPQVKTELDAGTSAGHVVIDKTWPRVVPLRAPLDPLATAAIDLGEAAVIQLAREQGIGVVCIDDRKGRRAALAVGLRITGSLGLLVRAKTLGLTPVIRPFIERAVRNGIWYDPELVRRVLAEMGE